MWVVFNFQKDKQCNAEDKKEVTQWTVKIEGGEVCSPYEDISKGPLEVYLIMKSFWCYMWITI